MKFIKDYSWILVFVAVVVFGATIASKPVNTIIQKQAPQMYGGTSPEISSPYIMVNGVRDWYSQTVLKTADNFVCNIASPAATTTLISSSIKFSVSSSTDSTIAVYKAAAVDTATTFLYGDHITAGAQKTVSATSTALGDNQVISPSQFIVFKMIKGASTGFTPTGVCQAVFREI